MQEINVLNLKSCIFLICLFLHTLIVFESTNEIPVQVPKQHVLRNIAIGVTSDWLEIKKIEVFEASKSTQMEKNKNSGYYFAFGQG